MYFKPTPLCLAILSLSLYSTLLHAEQKTFSMPVIEVSATKQATTSEKSKAYTIKNSRSATKLNIPVKETPQTVNVVTRQQMDDFQLSTTRDILKNTPGVTVTGLETNLTTYTARGFDISNILVDGVGVPQVDSYNYNNNDPDGYFYDRVEVIKGADALTNALGDPGATINYVRKRPTKDFEASAGISYGSWDTQRYEADISGSLTQDGRVRARLTGYEKAGNSYIDRYSEEKNGVQAIVEADITDSTTVSAGYSKVQQLSNGSQWGALPLINSAGQQLSYSRSYNYAPAWTYYDWSSDNYFAYVEQQLVGNWKAKLSYDEKSSTIQNKMLYLDGVPSASNNTSGISLYPEIYNQNLRERTINLNFNGSYGLFERQHEANFGYSWSDYHVKSAYALGSSYQILTTDLASWTPLNQTWNNLTAAADQDIWIKSLYGATRLHLTDDLKMILGANYTEIDNKNTYQKNKISPYAGLTYNFTPHYTGYVSYTSIFRPQTIMNNATGSVSEPVEGKSYELGLKSAWLNSRLTGSIAVFRTEQSNFPLNSTYNPTDFKYYSDLGTVRSQGVELGLAGKVSQNLEVSMGYSKFSLKNTESGVNPRQYNPTQTFNILTTYTVPQLPKLKVGASVQWQDAISDPITSNGYGLIKQGSYALLNLMASYNLNEHVNVQINANNVTDKKYLTGLYQGQGYYGAPANYMAAVKFKY